MNRDAEKWISAQFGTEKLRGLDEHTVEQLWLAMRWAYADAAKQASMVFPKRHTFSSENADIYSAQDDAIARCIRAIEVRASIASSGAGK